MHDVGAHEGADLLGRHQIIMHVVRDSEVFLDVSAEEFEHERQALRVVSH